MKAEDADGTWHFDVPLEDNSIIVCPGFQEASCLSQWRESSVYCEDCGDHPAMVCPICDEYHDHVWAPTFKVKDKQMFECWALIENLWVKGWDVGFDKQRQQMAFRSEQNMEVVHYLDDWEVSYTKYKPTSGDMK